MTKAFLLLALACCPVRALAGDTHMDLFGPQSVSGWVDLRLGASNGERSWLERGFGKLRTGANSERAALAEVALLLTPRLSETLTAQVRFQAVPQAQNPLGVSEAYLKWKPVPTSATRYGARLGRMFVPLSLEHDGPGWTTTRTLTPSAINSWVGEELLVDGLEASVQTTLGDDTSDDQTPDKSTFGVHTFGARMGVYRSADTAGTQLAFRGWALHDLAAAGNTRWPLPVGNGTGYSVVFGSQAPDSKPTVEVDGRMGYYARFDWRPPAPLALNLSYLYNPGTPTLVDKGQYGWTTRLVNAGLQAQLSSKDEVLSQVLWGTTKMGGIVIANRHAVDIQFRSAYVLVSHTFDNGTRLTARADTFAVIDRSWVDIDNNNETGHSATVAWIKPISGHLDFVAEAVKVSSVRPARLTQDEAPRQSQTQVQIAAKLHF